MPTINFLNHARDSGKISAHTRKVLEELITKSGVPAITITSTTRTADEQARIMYENIEAHGVDHQKKLYGPAGDKVIDEYYSLKKLGKSKDQIVNGMTVKINALGPGRVSRHAGDSNQINVVDIAPSSINLALRKKFEDNVKGDSRVSKFLTPPGDPAYHLEIPQP